jgi:hypothetical protein
MTPRSTAMRRALAIIGVCAWLVLALVRPDFFSRWSSLAGQIGGGVMMGTFFGTTTLAAVWLAFGRQGFAGRIGQWLACCLAIMAAATVNMWMGGVPLDRVPPISALLSAVAVVQSALIASLLWILGKTTGIRLCHLDALPADQQFGIRAVLVVTGLIAAILGGIRWALELHTPAPSAVSRAVSIYGYLVLCNLFMVLPLIVAPLLRRFALACTLGAIGFVVLVTAFEVSGLNQIERGPRDGLLVLLPLNLAQVGWLVLALFVVRRAGYRLSAATPASHRSDTAAAPHYDPA